MDYTPGDQEDPDCSKGNGDITEVTAELCRTNPFASLWDQKLNNEAPCIFPYTLNGERNDGCFLDDLQDFTRPVFRCPIRTVKGAGTNYTDEEVVGGAYTAGYFCPTNVNGQSVNYLAANNSFISSQLESFSMKPAILLMNTSGTVRGLCTDLLVSWSWIRRTLTAIYMMNMVNMSMTEQGRCSPPVKTTVLEVSISQQTRAITLHLSPNLQSTSPW